MLKLDINGKFLKLSLEVGQSQITCSKVSINSPHLWHSISMFTNLEMRFKFECMMPRSTLHMKSQIFGVTSRHHTHFHLLSPALPYALPLCHPFDVTWLYRIRTRLLVFPCKSVRTMCEKMHCTYHWRNLRIKQITYQMYILAKHTIPLQLPNHRVLVKFPSARRIKESVTANYPRVLPDLDLLTITDYPLQPKLQQPTFLQSYSAMYISNCIPKESVRKLTLG